MLFLVQLLKFKIIRIAAGFLVIESIDALVDHQTLLYKGGCVKKKSLLLLHKTSLLLSKNPTTAEMYHYTTPRTCQNHPKVTL